MTPEAYMQVHGNQVPQIARIPATISAGDRVRAWLTSPRGLLLIGIAAIAAGLALGWKWVVALGVAPIVLAFAPCALMCALGLCMMGMGRKAANPIEAPGPNVLGPVSRAIAEDDFDSQRTDART